MKLHELPDDVLRLVLKASLKTNRDIKAALKANLPLLTVCHRWRNLALAAVYSDVDIQYGSKPRLGSGPGDGRANNAEGGLDDAEIVTNLELVASAGCVQMVKRVQINMDYNMIPFAGFGAVIQLMRAAAEEWRAVKELKIIVAPIDVGHVHGISITDRENEIRKISAALAAIMPGICCVYFWEHGTNPIMGGLNGQLAALYSGQLKSLFSRHPIVVPPGHMLCQLKELTIWNLEGISYQHPRVDPTKLVSLDLTLHAPSQSWAPFTANDDSGEIVFPNLRSLRFKYWTDNAVDGAEVGRRHGRRWKLRFPKLESLTVASREDRCPLLENAVLPPRMDDIYIEARAPALMRVAETGLPTSRRIEVAIIPGSNGDPAALVAANRILDGAHESKERALRINDNLLRVLPESITCTSITALALLFDTSVDTMLGLIRMAPSLTRLDVLCLTLDNIQEDISVPGPDETCLMEPLSFKLNELWICVSRNEPVLEILASVTKYLLLRIPTLARFLSRMLPRKPIDEFVAAYSSRYPHLAGIKLQLKDTPSAE